MKTTKSYTTAMKRLADHLGWSLESTGRSWEATPPDGLPDGLSPFRGASRTILAMICGVALWPAPAGNGMTPEEVQEVIQLEVRRTRHGKPLFPKSATATEVAALGRVLALG